MKAGIHPDYYQAKVVCNCGNEFVTGSTRRRPTWRSAPSAILSIQVHRRLQRHADVSISSTRSTAFSSKDTTYGKRLGRRSQPFL